jgi:SAM-dependent methyltransferase
MSVLVASKVEHNQDDFELDPVNMRALWRMEEEHFWFSARNAWVLRALERSGLKKGASFLEVGCGSGAVAGFLHREGYSVTGVDTAEMLIRKADERCPSARFFVGRVEDLPDALHGPYDALGLFDVLEHLSDPAPLLSASIRWAKPGARVFITVPARRALHTIVDDLSGHKKRYEVGELSALMRSVGLRDPVEHGIFRLTQPLLLATRSPSSDFAHQRIDAERRREILLRSNRMPSRPVNEALRWLCAAELRILERFSRGRSGASLLAVATVGDRMN